MIIKKITVGFVVQSLDTNTNSFISQEFVAGDDVAWEDEYGEAVSCPDNDPYLPFDMVQPPKE